MRYFTLSQDENFHNIVSFKIKTVNPLQRRLEVTKDDVDGVNGVFRFVVDSHPDNFYPDVLDIPLFLISDRMAEVFRYYFDQDDFRAALLMDPLNKRHQLYWMPIIEKLDCLHESTRYSKNNFIEKPVVDSGKIQDHKIFRIDRKHEKIVVVSFEIVEGLLRRGCEGVLFKPVDVV